MQLIVLSAGRGSRLPKKFRNRPKCLVKLNSKPLLLYNENFFKHFEDKIIVTGFKQKYLKKISEKIGFTNVFNKKYSSTNMVYSLFLTKKKIKDDVVIVYGDIIFNDSVYELLKPKKNIIPVNINWYKNWKKRMSMNNIFKDAENIVVKENNLLEIGTKINKNKIPKYQFMGIVKLRKQTFLKCYDFFKKLNNKKVDMTSFLNLCISNKIMSLKVQKYKNYWYEIDSASDHKFAQRDLKKW
tara:strand:- start:3580 stop:4302 length:723 start_codon:yes stop_codon:yes gene_type:complete